MEAAKIARVCHEVNRAYCESIGDRSQVPWEIAFDWQKKAAYDGVLFRINNLDAPPSASHESWLKEKQDTGWIYGPVKDANLKTHPCCVPFDQLPVAQQAKDFIFTAIVRELKDM